MGGSGGNVRSTAMSQWLDHAKMRKNHSPSRDIVSTSKCDVEVRGREGLTSRPRPRRWRILRHSLWQVLAKAAISDSFG